MSKVKLKNLSRRMRTYHNPLRSTRVQQSRTVAIRDGSVAGKKAVTQIVPTTFSILPGAESGPLDERIVEAEEVRRDLDATPPILKEIRLEDAPAEAPPKPAAPKSVEPKTPKGTGKGGKD